MIDSQATTLIAAWREDATTARKSGHEQTAREIEAAADLFEKQAAEIKTLRENNTALQAECDEMNAELHEIRVASAEGHDAIDPIRLGQQRFAMRKAGYELEAAHLHLKQAIKERDELAAHVSELKRAGMDVMPRLIWSDAKVRLQAACGASPADLLKRRDAITAAKATRHAAHMVRTLDVISLDELASALDEVADMQEANDHGDAE